MSGHVTPLLKTPAPRFFLESRVLAEARWGAACFWPCCLFSSLTSLLQQGGRLLKQAGWVLVLALSCWLLPVLGVVFFPCVGDLRPTWLKWPAPASSPLQWAGQAHPLQRAPALPSALHIFPLIWPVNSTSAVLAASNTAARCDFLAAHVPQPGVVNAQ